MRLIRLLLALLLVVLPASAFAQEFPKLTGRVVDGAELLSPEQEAELTTLSEGIEQASRRQFVVVTVPDLQGYPIEDFGYRLGQAWKIGQAGADNGIILLVAPKERALRIEVGKGLEPIMTDGYAGLIIDKEIVPKFREGDMAGGIMAGAAAIAEQMKLPLEAAEARVKAVLDAERAVQASTPARSRSTPIYPGRDEIIAVVLIGGMILFFILGLARGGQGGRRYRSEASDIGNILLWTAIDAAARSASSSSSWSGGSNGSSWGGGGGSSWSGGGGSSFSGGGGSFGGGGASGSW